MSVLEVQSAKSSTVNYKAILFDLDGTLVDSVPIIIRTFREVHEKMGLPFDEVAVRKLVGIPLEEQAQILAGERANEFIDHYVPLYLGYQSAGVHLFPGTIEVLDELRRCGCRLAVVTSKSKSEAEQVLDQTRISDRFDVIVTADDVSNHKPHPEPILKALDLLGVDPDEAVFVGDSVFDICAGRSAGVDVVVVTWGARGKEDLARERPEGIFDTWQEMLDWLCASKSVCHTISSPEELSP